MRHAGVLAAAGFDAAEIDMGTVQISLVESTRQGKFVTYCLRRDVLESYIDRMAQI